jgi:hypothetical protein
MSETKIEKTINSLKNVLSSVGARITNLDKSLGEVTNSLKITLKDLNDSLKNLKDSLKESSKKTNTLQILLIIFTALMALAIIFQVIIMKQQTEILENTNPSYEPFIKIVPDIDDLIIPAWELTDRRNVENNWENDKRWARIDMTIYNFGKMDSQHIYCDPEEKNESIFSYITYNSTTNNIQNIPSGTSKRIKLHIRDKLCQLDEIDLCDQPELIPTGQQEIILNCNCIGCEKQRYFTHTINFCIYHEDRENDCPN